MVLAYAALHHFCGSLRRQRHRPYISQAGFTVFAIVLFCILLPLQKDVGIRRVEDIALGGVVGLVVSLVRRVGQPRST